MDGPGRQQTDPRVAEIVQAGRIRVALFLPQYVKHAVSGQPTGVGTGFIAIEMARELAARLGVALDLMEHQTPTETVEGLKANACDVAFLGIEPSRAAAVDFSPPIFQFDYTYLVPAGSAIGAAAEADRPGVRIAVVSSHASALALRRMVSHAQLVGSELPDAAFELLRAGKADAFALPREQLLDYSAALPGSRVLGDSYGINRVAMAVRKGRAGWLAYVGEFAAQAKASGFIERAIARGALRGFAVAGP
jgi:polar amino acid transport system substrate-binding protein